MQVRHFIAKGHTWQDWDTDAYYNSGHDTGILANTEFSKRGSMAETLLMVLGLLPTSNRVVCRLENRSGSNKSYTKSSPSKTMLEA